MSRPHECAENAVADTPCPGCGARRYTCTDCGDALDEWTDHVLEPCPAG